MHLVSVTRSNTFDIESVGAISFARVYIISIFRFSAINELIYEEIQVIK